jgi:branched-chain amino acid transport system substrate-binding protein
MKRLLISLLLLAPPAVAAEPVKIGEINSYTAIPAFTIPYRNGWQLAVEEINKAGGVMGGRKLEVLSRDDGGRPGEAVTAANDLIGQGAVMVTGTLLSHVALAVSDLAKQKKLVFLATEPMSDALVWSQGNRYTFRLRTSAHMHCAMLAEQAAKLPARRWATVGPNYEFGQSFTADFKKLLKARRPDVQFVAELWQPLGKLDAAATVQALEQAKPEAIFNTSFAGDLAKLVREGKAQGLFKGRAVISALTGEPEYLDVLADEAPEGWIVTGYPWDDIKTPEHRKFVDAYMAAYGEDPRMGALIGYDAMKAIAAALDKANSTDSAKLAAAFEGLTFATPAGPVTFRAVDHQATMGTWIGKTALKDGSGVMTDWTYLDGAKYLPPAEEARKLRGE